MIALIATLPLGIGIPYCEKILLDWYSNILIDWYSPARFSLYQAAQKKQPDGCHRAVII
jgi:hypothetical protein